MHKDGGRRRKKCKTRMSFSRYRSEPPRCPCCGRTDGWREERKHRKKDRARETCVDPMCPIFPPHSIYSEACIHNPKSASRDPFEMGGESLGSGEECPF